MRQLRCHAISCPVAPLRCWHLSHKVHTWSHLINVIGDLHELAFGGILVPPILLKLNGASRARWGPRNPFLDPSCAPLLVFQLDFIFSRLIWAVTFMQFPLLPHPHQRQLREGRTWVTFIMASPAASSVPGTPQTCNSCIVNWSLFLQPWKSNLFSCPPSYQVSCDLSLGPRSGSNLILALVITPTWSHHHRDLMRPPYMWSINIDQIAAECLPCAQHYAWH